MKLNEFNRKADDYTSKASDIVRQMLLGAVGIIWIFKGYDDSANKIDGFLFYPLLTICIAFICDLLQYVSGGIIWKEFFRKKEKEIFRLRGQGEEVKAPSNLNLPIYVFYWLKITLLLVSYALIAIHISSKLSFS